MFKDAKDYDLTRIPRKMSAEHRAKVSKNASSRSAETRRKIGDVHRGKTVSAETRAKLSLAATGRKFTAERNEAVKQAVLDRAPRYQGRRMQEWAEFFGVTKQTVFNWKKSGQLDKKIAENT